MRWIQKLKPEQRAVKQVVSLGVNSLYFTFLKRSNSHSPFYSALAAVEVLCRVSEVSSTDEQRVDSNENENDEVEDEDEDDYDDERGGVAKIAREAEYENRLMLIS